ncbi:MAG: hypothetical protein Ct9H90mP9_3970 [Pseudomonadota bacterium]|nr:MAG: hypothetical protein Ct9H90mP9_3970 [Pseudomonadota bacterium]
MSSTEYHVNRKELQFVVMEVLEAGNYAALKIFRSSMKIFFNDNQ